MVCLRLFVLKCLSIDIFYFAIVILVFRSARDRNCPTKNSNFSSAVLYLRQGSVLETSNKTKGWGKKKKKYVIEYKEEHKKALGFPTCFSYILNYKKNM